MRVLVGCEFSGTVRDAFLEKGHDAWSCDLLPSEGKPLGHWYPHLYPEGHQLSDKQFHYQCDIKELFFGGHLYQTMALENQAVKWDLLIAHPPCTYLSNSGIRWLYKQGRKENGRNESRWEAMKEGANFVIDLWNAPVERVCIEQPLDHIYAEEIINIPVTQILQPWMFGHWELKAICLRLKNLPTLIPFYKTIKECQIALGLPSGTYPEAKVHQASPGKDRWKVRSTFYKGIADAMAEQWGSLDAIQTRV